MIVLSNYFNKIISLVLFSYVSFPFPSTEKKPSLALQIFSSYDVNLFNISLIVNWIRLNYPTTHHHPLSPTTIHHRPKYINHHHHHQLPPTISQPLSTISQSMPTTIHHDPPSAEICPPPSTTTHNSQNISTITKHNSKYIQVRRGFIKKILKNVFKSRDEKHFD